MRIFEQVLWARAEAIEVFCLLFTAGHASHEHRRKYFMYLLLKTTPRPFRFFLRDKRTGQMDDLAPQHPTTSDADVVALSNAQSWGRSQRILSEI